MALHSNPLAAAIVASLFVINIQALTESLFGGDCTIPGGSHGVRCPPSVGDDEGRCIPRVFFCDGEKDCPDGSDEATCDGCQFKQFRCSNSRCIENTRVCDHVDDCGDGSDEMCEGYINNFTTTTTTPTPVQTTKTTTPAPSTTTFAPEEGARERLLTWFLSRRGGNGWGYELPRIATALFLGRRELFSPPDRSVTHEMGLELSNQLLARLDSRGNGVSTAELAGFVHALLVTCVDPRDFYGRDLVSELRARGGSRSPLAVLALCNAGLALGPEDVHAIREVYETKKRPFWTDTKALSLLALSCLSSRGLLAERIPRELGQELKRRQFGNGTVDNTRTTALTLQALFATDNWEGDFDVGAAMRALVQAQREDGSIGSLLDSYYALPALARTSLANITNSHCKTPEKNERETIDGLRGSVSGSRIGVTHSVWIGGDVDVVRTSRLRVATRTSAYALIETVRTLDSKLNVQYTVSEGKPYVSSVFGIDDDPEKGVFWFTYLRPANDSQQTPTLLKQSPVDVILEENQELILWYKAAEWVDASIPTHSTPEGDTDNCTTPDI